MMQGCLIGQAAAEAAYRRPDRQWRHQVGLEVGPFAIPLPGVQGEGYIDWLYLDDELRITRGNKGSLFVHIREEEEEEDDPEVK